MFDPTGPYRGGLVFSFRIIASHRVACHPKNRCKSQATGTTKQPGTLKSQVACIPCPWGRTPALIFLVGRCRSRRAVCCRRRSGGRRRSSRGGRRLCRSRRGLLFRLGFLLIAGRQSDWHGYQCSRGKGGRKSDSHVGDPQLWRPIRSDPPTDRRPLTFPGNTKSVFAITAADVRTLVPELSATRSGGL